MADILAFPTRLKSRPYPPQSIALEDDFAPDGSLGAWVAAMFLAPDGPLYNPRHDHLREAEIGWIWTTAAQMDRDKAVAGQCELVQPMQRKWSSARQHWLLRHWFGAVPDFVITIDVGFAATADDWAFCALIEHELCHAAQDIDTMGEPRFDREGRPVFRIIGHDVEQFDDVVERYGATAAGVERMVRLANAGPTIGQARIDAACGTCGRKRA